MKTTLHKLILKISVAAMVMLSFSVGAQPIIACWSYDVVSPFPNTEKSVAANFGAQQGTAFFYLNGTNGSSNFTSGQFSNVGGTLNNDPRGGSATAGSAYRFIPGTGQSANGNSMVFKFSATGYENLIAKYAIQTSTNGFPVQQWAYSTDGVNWTNFGGGVATYEPTYTVKTLDFAAVPALDNATWVYLRLTLNGATTSLQSVVRLDNFVVRGGIQIPTFGSISQTATTCADIPTNFSVTGLIPNSTSSLTYTINGGSTQTVAGLTSDASGNGSFLLPVAQADNGMTLTITSVQRTDFPTTAQVVTSNNTVMLSAVNNIIYYADVDGDGFGDPDNSQPSCTGAPTGFITDNTDCDDNNAAVNTGGTEIYYNGIDDNCDGVKDEGQQITTKVKANQCGGSVSKLYSQILVNQVPNATRYRFMVVDGTNTQFYETANSYFQLTQLASHQYNTVYSISVEVQLNGIWLGYYGDVCTVASPVLTPAIAGCGITQNGIYNSISTPVVPNATMYRFEITDENLQVQTIERQQSWFQLTMLDSYEYSMTYSIRAAVMTTDVYGPYGPTCSVTTPTVAATIKQCGQTYTSIHKQVNSVIIPNVSGYKFFVTNLNSFAEEIFEGTDSFFTISDIVNYESGTQYYVQVAVRTTGEYGDYGTGCIITTPGAAPVAVTEVEDNSTELRAAASPNPYNETFALNLDSERVSTVNVKVYNMLGHLVEQREVAPADLEAQRLGSNFVSGVYNVVITQGDLVKSLLVVKR